MPAHSHTPFTDSDTFRGKIPIIYYPSTTTKYTQNDTPS